MAAGGAAPAHVAASPAHARHARHAGDAADGPLAELLGGGPGGDEGAGGKGGGRGVFKGGCGGECKIDVPELESDDVFKMDFEKYPENKCFCEGEDLCDLIGDGMFAVSKCQFNAPIILSWPHFLDANQTFFEKVEGKLSTSFYFSLLYLFHSGLLLIFC